MRARHGVHDPDPVAEREFEPAVWLPLRALHRGQFAVVLLIFAPCCATRLSTPRGAGLRWWSADLSDPAVSAALDEDSEQARCEETV